MKFFNHIRNIMTAAMIALASSLTSMAQTADPGFNVIPDKIVSTDSGVRISVCLVGIPSTSQRIDGIDLVDGQTTMPATDIDGIDFKRDFQFEDAGVLVIEVDFPYKGSLSKTASLIFHTEKGDIKASVRQ